MKKILMGLGFATVLVIASIILLYFYSPSTPYIIISKFMFSHSKHPELYLVPQNREVHQLPENASDLPAETYYGLTFKSPFGKEIEKKSAGDLTALKFQNGMGLLIRNKQDGQKFKQLNEQVKAEIANTIREKGLSHNKAAIDYLSKFDFDSQYDQYNSFYSASPEKISVFSTKQDSVFTILQLTMKSIAPGMGLQPSSIYRYDTGKTRGFQLNLTEMGKKTIWLLIYDLQGDEYLIDINGDTYSQDDIDIILASLKTTDK